MKTFSGLQKVDFCCGVLLSALSYPALLKYGVFTILKWRVLIFSNFQINITVSLASQMSNIN